MRARAAVVVGLGLVGLAAALAAGARAAWRALSAVTLNGGLEAWLDRLQQRLPFQVTVTSGVRTPAAQAAAMAAKLRRGEDLYALYKRDDLVAEVLDAAGDPADPDEEAMAAVIEAQVARGDYLSAHLTGRALDLRTRDLASDQVAALEDAARAAGARTVLLESDHLHVEIA